MEPRQPCLSAAGWHTWSSRRVTMPAAITSPHQPMGHAEPRLPLKQTAAASPRTELKLFGERPQKAVQGRTLAVQQQESSRLAPSRAPKRIPPRAGARRGWRSARGSSAALQRLDIGKSCWEHVHLSAILYKTQPLIQIIFLPPNALRTSPHVLQGALWHFERNK